MIYKIEIFTGKKIVSLSFQMNDIHLFFWNFQKNIHASFVLNLKIGHHHSKMPETINKFGCACILLKQK